MEDRITGNAAAGRCSDWICHHGQAVNALADAGNGTRCSFCSTSSFFARNHAGKNHNSGWFRRYLNVNDIRYDGDDRAVDGLRDRLRRIQGSLYFIRHGGSIGGITTKLSHRRGKRRDRSQ